MATKTTNPVPQALTSAVAPGDMLKFAIQQGKALHTQALVFCLSAAAWLLTVNHFKDTKADGYMSKAKASEYLREKLAEATGVKGRMLANYLAPAEVIHTALTTSATLYAPILQRLGTAKTPDAMVGILQSWIDEVKGKKHKSLTDLQESLGYSTPVTRKAKPLTAARGIQQVDDVLERVTEKLVDSGKMKARDLAPVIVSHISEQNDKGAFVVSAIEQIASKSVLETVVKAAQRRMKELDALAEKAADVVKVKAKTGNKTTGRSEKKRNTQVRHTQA